jgi:2-methylcitrate dehydratase
MPPAVQDAAARAEAALAGYVGQFDHALLPAEVVWKAKAHVLDVLGAIIAGSSSLPARLARQLAVPRAEGGASVIGSAIVTTPDMAAFANAVAARGVDTLDVYHQHGKQGHPGDVVAPVLTIAEHAGAGGRDLIAAIVLAYEVFGWLRDGFEHKGFDNTNCARIAAAAAAARLMRLGPQATAECLALAAASANALKEVRSRPAVMTRNTTAGYQARGAILAAMMAAAGAKGPAGALGEWCRHVAAGAYDIASLGGEGARFRILDSWLKLRAIPGVANPIVYVAEKLAAVTRPDEIERITLELYGKLKKGFGEGEKRWKPDTADTADHSAPFIMATILAKGELTLRSFDPDHIGDERIRAIMPKVEIVENEAFTAAYRQHHEHRARATLIKTNGERHVAETGGDADDLAAPRTEGQLNEKFALLAGGRFGPERIAAILSDWWRLEEAGDVATLIAALNRP